MELPTTTTSAAQLLENLLNSEVDSGSSGASNLGVTHKRTNYRDLAKYQNVLSYSMEQTLQNCPRKFKLMKLRADCEDGEPDMEPNVDFAFGHAVGAGVAEFDRTRDVSKAIFAAFLAWNIDLLATGQKKDSGRDPKKSFAHAVWALKLYESFFEEERLDEYYVEHVEATIAVDLEDGNFYVGHIDELLKHQETGRLKIKENKTTVFDAVDPALYANSDQALSYAVVVDTYGETDYDVFYCIYSTTSQRWIAMSFVKSALDKAEWLQGQLLLTNELAEYSRINFFPKHGQTCFNFSRRCEFFEVCGFDSDRTFGKKFSDLEVIKNFEELEAVEPLNFKIRLSDLIQHQEKDLISQGSQQPHPNQGHKLLKNTTGMESL